MENFKNKNIKPLVPTIIIDDFFESPSLWLEYAKQLEYFKGDRGTWPGYRSDLFSNMNTELQNIIDNKLLQHLFEFDKFTKNDISIQCVSEEWGQGWIHDDDPKFYGAAGVIFLNKKYPKNTGTTIYNQQIDPSYEKFGNIFFDDVTDVERKHNDLYLKHQQEQKQMFKETIKVEGRYNRCLIFDPRQWHAADNYFGTSKDDSRYTIVFFVNNKDSLN